MFVDFLDELGSGIGPTAAPEIRDDFALDYTDVGLILLIAPLLLGLLVEGPLLLRSDRWQRERVATWCLAAMGACMLAAASASSPWSLALALAAWGCLGGLGCNLAQGALMRAFPTARERWMTRWALMGSLGDAATPLLLIGVGALGGSWRMALAIAGALHLLHAIVLARVRANAIEGETIEDESDGEAELGSSWARLRGALGDRRLLAWLSACASCCLLDEILVAFAAMYLRDELAADRETIAAACLLLSVGGALGLLACDWLLSRIDARRLLIAASLSTIVVFCVWLSSRELTTSLVALALLGMFAAPLYPICAARAYAARPEQPGLVAAIDHLFAPVPILAPLLLGVMADHLGLVAALTVLSIEPLVVLAVAALALRRL